MEHEKMKVKKVELLRYAMLALAVLLLVASVVQAYQIAAIGKAENTAAGTGTLDTASWTEEEKMNYDMHGIIPARVKSSSSSVPLQSQQAPTMVGGC
jgi:hypothetical protein